MTDDATTAADPKHAPPGAGADAHRSDATPEPTLEGEALQDQIAELANVVTTGPEPVAAPDPESPIEEASAVPAPEAAAESPPEPAPLAPKPDAESPVEDEAPPATSGYEGVADPFAADAKPTGAEDFTPEPESPAGEEVEKPAKKSRGSRTSKKAAALATPDEEEAAAAEPTAAGDAEVVEVAEGEGEGGAPDVSAEPPPPENKKKWYAIKVQSGREDTIKAAILRKVAIEGLEDGFGQIMIPFEEVIEKKQVRVKDKKTGDYVTQEKKVTRRKKKFQGYLFAELEFNDRILYLFRETSGVGDFLNLRGTPPVPEPMPDHEVQAMLTGVSVKPGGPSKAVKLEFEKGDRVRIKEGSFINQEGEVKEIILPRDPTDAPKVIIEVTFWGQKVPVDLEYWQVAKV